MQCRQPHRQTIGTVTAACATNSRLDPALVGRTDARLRTNPRWCYELSTGVAGGCSAWFTFNTGNGNYSSCQTPNDGSNRCQGSRFVPS